MHITNNEKLVFLIILPIIAWALSTYLHDPSTQVLMGNFGFKYSDIVYGLFYTIFRPGNIDKWYNASTYVNFLNSQYKCPVPYVDYKFEYPPVIGVLWYASTCIGFMISSNVESSARVHFYINSFVLLVSFILTSITLYKITTKIHSSGMKEYHKHLLLITPTTVIYLVYNWDIIAALFAVLGVWFFINRKYFKAGVSLGLSFSTKILTAGLIFYFLVKLLTTNEGNEHRLVKYLIGLTLTGIVPFMALYIITPQGFTDFINHHASWYCENCLYLPLSRNIYSDLNRRLYFSIGTCLMLIIATLLAPWKNIELKQDTLYYLATIMTLIIFNYVFSPQMMLMITPFAILALNKPFLYVYLLADFFNALIIILFFTEPNPWVFGSNTQYVAFARNIILLFLLVYVLVEIIRNKLNTLNTTGESY
ncbi:MAG: hypothetical protein QXK41_04160 [Desulfurococcaceae archaeon]